MTWSSLRLPRAFQCSDSATCKKRPDWIEVRREDQLTNTPREAPPQAWRADSCNPFRLAARKMIDRRAIFLMTERAFKSVLGMPCNLVRGPRSEFRHPKEDRNHAVSPELSAVIQDRIRSRR